MIIKTLTQQHNPALKLLKYHKEDVKTIPERRYNEIMSILQKSEATHNERLWICGYLSWTGFTAEEVMQIIDTHNQWFDYNSRITWYQVCSVFKTKANVPRSAPYRRRKTRKQELPPLSTTQQKRIHDAKEMMDRMKWSDGLVKETVTTLEPDTSNEWVPILQNGFVMGYERRN